MKSSKKEAIPGILITEKKLPLSAVGQETAVNAIAFSKANEDFLGNESAPAAGIIMQDGRIIQANASFCEKFNLQGQQDSCNFLDYLSAADRRLLQRKLLLASHSGNACKASLQDKKTNQQLNLAIHAANGLLYLKEEPAPQARARVSVTHSEAVSTLSLLEIIPLPALLYNRSHKVLMINQMLAGLYNKSISEVLNESKAEEIILAGNNSRLGELRTALLAGSLPEIKYQMQIGLPGEEKRWMEYAEKVLPEGSVSVFSEAFSIAVLYDIQELEQQKEMLRNREEEVNLFMDRASHDLKGPLKSMMSLYPIMEYEFGPDAGVMEYVRHYHNGISRLYRLLEDMLQLSRLNKTEQHYSSINLQQMVEECLQSFRNLPGFFNISFTKQINLPSEVVLDESLLQTIVQNLLENAIKYCAEEKPEVKICIREENNGIRLEVADNGIGIPAEMQARVFDRYFRATSQASGSGLGLYLLKQAVDKLKGQVSLESEEGQGTTFFVCLPYSC
jgi:signal transduction histidine kinase